uniref:Uncharacterized protein n=1 Tax=Nicotiana tabacum TaxID=4097 RepID=A0A1S4BS84_TOBAC|nr:PREDICTED: uncharacterized protein LOC107811275 [Nicotiana tabacum]
MDSLFKSNSSRYSLGVPSFSIPEFRLRISVDVCSLNQVITCKNKLQIVRKVCRCCGNEYAFGHNIYSPRSSTSMNGIRMESFFEKLDRYLRDMSIVSFGLEDTANKKAYN